MRGLSRILSAAALLLPISCAKDAVETVVPEARQQRVCSFTAGVKGVGTSVKAQTLSGEEAIEDVQIMVFREDGCLEAYGKATAVSEIELKVVQGSKTVCALVNAPVCGAKSLGELDAFRISLRDNSRSRICMSGSTDAEISGGECVEVPVKRMLSRVVVKKIRRDFVSEPLKIAPFRILCAYIRNCPADVDFSLGGDPWSWVNTADEPDTTVACAWTKVDCLVANGKSYDVPAVNYCCPVRNAGRVTRLVVEAELDSVRYYYPITLNPVLDANVSYEISELTITRPGSDDPDTPVSAAQCTFSIRVLDWEEGVATTEPTIL